MNPPSERSWLQQFVMLVGLSLVSIIAWADEPKEKVPTEPPGNGKEVTRPKKEEAIQITKHFFRIEPSEEYVIGPEDVLAINVWREPEISRTVPVRPDGKISLPLVGELKASGLTPENLQAKITEELRGYLSQPEVTVIVQEVHSQKFNVVGEVLRPGSYQLARPITVLDAIAVVGGFTEWAKVTKIYVLRRLQDGKRIRIPFNYKDVVKGKNFFQNIELEPGDTIVVP